MSSRLSLTTAAHTREHFLIKMLHSQHSYTPTEAISSKIDALDYAFPLRLYPLMQEYFWTDENLRRNLTVNTI